MSGKVLVVDDDSETRMIVSDLLSKLNVDHTTVATAGDCLARLVSAPREFCLVLMDIHMPHLSGADASIWIKDSEINPPQGIPIIAMTGDAAFFAADALVHFGMAGVLHKPITLDSLRVTLQQHGATTRFH